MHKKSNSLGVTQMLQNQTSERSKILKGIFSKNYVIDLNSNDKQNSDTTYLTKMEKLMLKQGLDSK